MIWHKSARGTEAAIDRSAYEQPVRPKQRDASGQRLGRVVLIAAAALRYRSALNSSVRRLIFEAAPPRIHKS